jgi:hypothetical protein
MDDVMTLTKDYVNFTVIERRGGCRVGYAPREPLPYALFNMKGQCVARVADRVMAGWLLDCLEGEANTL